MSDTRAEPLYNLDQKLLTAKKIVVIGDGPFALAEAIALKNKGIDVSIVGPRLGNVKNYTRSGDYSKQYVITAINLLIAPEKINETTGRHIKDLEIQLHHIASKLNIPLIDQEFSGFVNSKEIEIADKNNVKSKISADLIIDCSGTTRVSLKKVNAIHPNTFTFEEIQGNPHKSYAQIRAIMSNEEYKTFRLIANPKFKPDPIVYALVMQELREMGWKNFSIPRCYGNKFLKKTKNPENDEYVADKNLVKVNIYTQIPEGMLLRENIEKFVNTIIKITQNNADNVSLFALTVQEYKRTDKPMVSTFPVSPVKTEQALYLGGPITPPILHMGDATLNMPFYSGESITRGVLRIIALNQALMTQDGILTINTKLYEEIFTTIMAEQIELIKEQFLIEDTRITSGNQSALEYYRAAYGSCINPIDKRKIAKGLQQLLLDNKTVSTSENNSKLSMQFATDTTFIGKPGLFHRTESSSISTTQSAQFFEESKASSEELLNIIHNLVPEEERAALLDNIDLRIQQAPMIYTHELTALTLLLKIIPQEFNVIRAIAQDILNCVRRGSVKEYFLSNESAKQMLCAALVVGVYKNITPLRNTALNLIASMQLKNEIQPFLQFLLGNKQHGSVADFVSKA